MLWKTFTERESLKPVRVLIVDDHEAVRVGLQTMLSQRDSITIVGEAANVTRPWHNPAAFNQMWSCWTSACPTEAE
jgi:CheY-like chemotaxis protein